MKWELKKIDDVAIISKGDTPDKDKREYWTGGTIPWITSSSCKNEKIFESKEFITKEGLKNCSANIYPVGTTFIALVGATIGKVAISMFETATNDNVAGLVPKNSKILNRDYLYYAIRNLYANFVHLSDGKFRRATIQFVKNLRIPIPPIEEQERIAKSFNLLDRIANKRKKSLKKLEQFSLSIFINIFENPFVRNSESIPLGDIADITMGQSPKGSTYNSNGVGIYLLNGPTEFGEKYPTPVQWTSDPKKLCNKGDILFCVRGSSAGRLNFSNGRYCIGRGLAAINSRDPDVFNNSYLYILLKHYYLYFQNKGVGSTFINISKDDLISLSVPKVKKEDVEKFKFFERDYILLENRMKNQASALNSLVSSLQNNLFDLDSDE